MLLKEVLTSKAHKAPHCSKAEFFERATDPLNGNCGFTVHVNGKTVRDRYGRMQKFYIQKNRKGSVLYGMGGEVNKAEVRARKDRRIAVSADVVA